MEHPKSRCFCQRYGRLHFGKEERNYEYISRSIELYNKLLPHAAGIESKYSEAEIYKNLSDSYKLLARGSDKDLVAESINTAVKSWDLFDAEGDTESATSLKQQLAENLSLFVYLEANTGNIESALNYLNNFLSTHENRINNEEGTKLRYEFLLELRKLASIENIKLIAEFVTEFKNSAEGDKSQLYAEESDKHLIDAYLTLGAQHSMVNDFANAEELLQNAHKLSESINDFPERGEIAYQLGLHHKRKWEQKNNKDEITKSIENLNKALETADEERSSEITGFLEKLQSAFDSEDVDNAGELEIYDEIADDDSQVIESEPEDTETVVDINMDSEEPAPDYQDLTPAPEENGEI